MRATEKSFTKAKRDSRGSYIQPLYIQGWVKYFFKIPFIMVIISRIDIAIH